MLVIGRALSACLAGTGTVGEIAREFDESGRQVRPSVSWTICVPGLDAAEEITRLHRRAAQTAFAHIFPAEAPPPPFDEDLARWRFWLGADREQGRQPYTVEADGRIVGVVLAGPDPDDPAVGHLARFYVDPDRWGTGIGTALHDVAIADLANRRFLVATLWVLEDNVRARRWYERLGWIQTSERKPSYEPAGIYDARYVRDLHTSR